MKIFNTLDEIRIEEKTAVALGNFDGIHVGHDVILRDALEQAKKLGLKSLCYTFSNHPFNFIMGREETDPTALKQICSEEDKIRMLEGMGFDYLVNVPFDEVTMKMCAHDFFENVLMGSLNASSVSVGFNYTYGARAEGKAADLVRDGEDNGITVCVHDAVVLDDKVISSTLIRGLIAAGDMELTAKYLGRPYSFTGIVEHGRRVGGKLGFPTINLKAPANRALPPNGVYYSRILIDGTIYPAVSNIGVKPTFDDAYVQTGKTIETHVFDYDGDAYDCEVTVYFDRFGREEMRFKSSEDLHAQIEKDCEAARDFHLNREKN